MEGIIPMSNSVSSTELMKVMHTRLLNATGIGGREGKERGEDTELSILRRETWRELGRMPDYKATALEPTCAGVHCKNSL